MKKANYKKIIALALASIVGTASTKYSSAAEFRNYEDESLEKESFIKAIDNVNVRSLPTTSSKILGTLKIGEIQRLYTDLNNGWYEIEYNNDIAYVSSKYASIYEKYYEKNKDAKLGAILKDTVIINNGKTYQVNKNDLVTIINENNVSYLVQIDDKEGYIKKSDIERLMDTYVIVDISDQELKLYENNQLILTSPVVTGTPTESRHSDEGLFSIYDISYNRELIGQNNSYRSYVDVMMKYNNGEGLHDAQYHNDYDSAGNLVKSHGWRSESEFGGDTYLTDGSHGCVNMLHDDAIEVSNHVVIGTKVLVKK